MPKHRSHRHGGRRGHSMLNTAARLTADALVAGPVLVPIIEGGTKLMGGAGIGTSVGTFSASAIAYDTTQNKFLADQLPAILIRDVAMVGGGLLLRKYVVKRVR